MIDINNFVDGTTISHKKLEDLIGIEFLRGVPKKFKVKYYRVMKLKNYILIYVDKPCFLDYPHIRIDYESENMTHHIKGIKIENSECM